MTLSARSTIPWMLSVFGAIGCHDGLRPELTISASLAPHIMIYQGPFVAVSLRNESGRPIQLAACGGTDVLPVRERFVDGHWISDPIGICTKPLELRELVPEEVVNLGSWNFSSLSGTYRFRAPLFQDAAHARASRDASAAITIP